MHRAYAKTIGVGTGGGGGQETFEGEKFCKFWCLHRRKKQFHFGGPNVIYSDMRCMYEYKVSWVKYWGRPGPPHYTAEIPSQLVLFVVTLLGSSLKLSEISIFVRKCILN